MEDNKEMLEQEVDGDIVVLQDQDGNDIAFHYVTTIEFEGKEFVCLQEAVEDEEGGELEIYELETIEENGEQFDNLLPIDDELYEVLYAKLVAEINAHEADDECECGGEHHCGCGCDHEDK